ncbi:hypothetical protein AVEN_172488-1 [Araneus ventricosus]|uniref:Uncharacterized protein n=1 Tax=Araneus ventricosus TaxID=182803 RepID=A0A4Y2DRX0_ARAVE|nr:hypothetical protein AVEN_172488-1 [Araneus ventricosus]
MTRTTPHLLQTSAPHQREDVWPPAYDLARSRPNTRRRIFGGLGFRTWNLYLTTRPPQSQENIKSTENSFGPYKRLHRHIVVSGFEQKIKGITVYINFKGKSAKNIIIDLDFKGKSAKNIIIDLD